MFCFYLLTQILEQHVKILNFHHISRSEEGVMKERCVKGRVELSGFSSRGWRSSNLSSSAAAGRVTACYLQESTACGGGYRQAVPGDHERFIQDLRPSQRFGRDLSAVMMHVETI